MINSAPFIDKKNETNSLSSMNRAYLAYVYGNKGLTDTYTPTTKTEYYNEVDPKKKQKKVLKIVGITAAALATVGAVIGGFFIGKSGAFQKLVQQAGEVNVKDTKAFKATDSTWSNFNNIKDDAWDRFVVEKSKEKPFLGFISKFADKLKGIYLKGAKTCYKEDYSKAFDALKDAVEKSGDTSLIKEFDAIQNYEDFFTTLNGDIFKSVKESRITKGILDGKTKKEKLMGFFKKLSDSNIADKQLIEIESIQKAAKDTTLITDNQEVIEALNKFNEAKKITASRLIPKLRDINLGSAVTDANTIIFSTLGLGLGIAMADEKSEKKSIAINLGVPLLGTLGCNVFMTLRCITGAPALLFSLAVGQLAKMGAKIATGVRDKKEILE